MRKLRTVFFGTPDFALPSLEVLHKHPLIDLAGVVTMPDRPSGRGHQLRSPEVAEYAKANKLPLFQTENINRESEYIASLEEKGVDLFIVLAFAQFLGSKLLSLPKEGCFNIHTSLLPKYRGAAPIQYALLNGDSETGVSIQRMVKKMDAGDIALSRPVPVSKTETGGQLYTRLKFQAGLSLNDFIYSVIDGSVELSKQDESKVSFAPTLKKEDGFLDFKNKSAQELQNILRALDPWPGAFCFLNNKRLKAYVLEPSEVSLAPGETSIKGNQLLIGAKDRALRIPDLQLEGKKRCSDSALLNGLKNSIKEININPE